jgi:SulP family sulfate permease
MFNAIKFHSSNLHLNRSVGANLKYIPTYFARPVRFLRNYDRSQLRPDLMAGLTVAVVLLPQVIAFALIAGLPPEMGLYTAIIGAFIGALWGSCYQLQTGPVNTISLLVLSVLLPIATPGSPRFIVAAGLLALMVGVFQLIMGLARMGVLVNFVSYSVVVGFSSGAGLLIIINELRHLLGLEFSSGNVLETGQNVIIHLFSTHWPTALLGFSIIILLLLIRKFNPKLPGALISMVVASAAVFLFDLRSIGVNVIGELPAHLPPIADLPLFDLTFIAQLSTGALAVGSIGLVQTTAIARSIASQTGQRLDSNQEFVGQGLANIASGLFSGFNCAASFSASAVNFKAGLEPL